MADVVSELAMREMFGKGRDAMFRKYVQVAMRLGGSVSTDSKFEALTLLSGN